MSPITLRHPRQGTALEAICRQWCPTMVVRWSWIWFAAGSHCHLVKASPAVPVGPAATVNHIMTMVRELLEFLKTKQALWSRSWLSPLVRLWANCISLKCCCEAIAFFSSYAAEIGTSYYAVAVVRKSSNITIDSLKGVGSCHTGINRTAGWDVPVGYLIDSGRLAAMGCDLPTAISEYFSASCVPGANGANYPTSLCQLCKGDLAGQNKCEQNSQEQYYDYSGAFR